MNQKRAVSYRERSIKSTNLATRHLCENTYRCDSWCDGLSHEYNGHTLPLVLEQVARLTGKLPQKAKVDRGYRGKKQIGETSILIPSTPKKSASYYQRKKLGNALKNRTAIEPIRGHIKSDHRLNRNFYKGIVGDNINIMLAAAAFNFKRMMNKWKKSFWPFLQRIFQGLFYFDIKKKTD